MGSGCGLDVVSPDGRFVVFSSLADNLVPNDQNGARDVFLRDRQTSQTVLVSVSSTGIQSNDDSFDGGISADGNLVGFRSDATNLVPGVSHQIYVHDRLTAQTTLVSKASDGTPGNALSSTSSISSDGRFVVFMSYSDNLVPGDTNNYEDIFVHELATGSTERVSVSHLGNQGFGPSTDPSISADGRYVAFWSDAINLVLGDGNGAPDIFVRDRVALTTVRASVNSLGEEANQGGWWPSISPDGHYVSFASTSTNLVLTSLNGGWDCYVHDLLLGETRIVSVDGGGNPSNGTSTRSSIALQGRVVAFNSSSNDLVPGPSFSYPHNYVHTVEGCPFVEGYCHSSGTSLSFCQMELLFAHAALASSPADFKLWSAAPGGNLGMCIVGANGPANLPFGTLGGAVCVQPPFWRLPPQAGGGSPVFCNGVYTYTLADIAAATPLVVAGTELCAQMWSRDPANPDGFALSDALRFAVCP